jgi:hypothetical protein
MTMTQKFSLTASVAAIALAVGTFAMTGDALAKSGGGGSHGSHGSSQSSARSFNSSSNSSMKMSSGSSSSYKHHHHHHRKRIIVSGSGDGCDGYIRNGVCIEDDDDED